MPLVLADDRVAFWIDPSRDSPLDQDLMLDQNKFTVHPMDRAMNNARQKDLAAFDPEIKAARQVGPILKHVEFGTAVSPDFRRYT